jgi:hypothetical protein
MPVRIFNTELHKPVDEQVVVQLLQQQPCGADAIDQLQKRGQ